MSDEVEIETSDLQETVEELHREREERQKEERQSSWTRYIALTTAILAAFAAIAALQSGALSNEGMINQLDSSDTWNEYQADSQKMHLYSIEAAQMLDSKIAPSPKNAKHKEKGFALVSKMPGDRLRQYLDEVQHESTKLDELKKKATELKKESEHNMHGHHRFAYSVALLQVAIALGAVSALTRIKTIWLVSSVLGLGGIALFAWGFLGK